MKNDSKRGQILSKSGFTGIIINSGKFPTQIQASNLKFPSKTSIFENLQNLKIGQSWKGPVPPRPLKFWAFLPSYYAEVASEVCGRRRDPHPPPSAR